MSEQLLEEATRAFYWGDRQEGQRLMQQLASTPEETMKVLLESFKEAKLAKQAVAIRIMQMIGYPQNVAAIPELIYHIGDPNLPGWEEAVWTLIEMGADVIMPHLLKAILSKEPPYHRGEGKSLTWSPDVEGICGLLLTAPQEYAIRCCPAITYLLSRDEPKGPDIEMMLDVVEKAGIQQTYVLPTLIALATKYHARDEGKHAREMIFSFPQEILEPYQLLLTQLEDSNSAIG